MLEVKLGAFCTPNTYFTNKPWPLPKCNTYRECHFSDSTVTKPSKCAVTYVQSYFPPVAFHLILSALMHPLPFEPMVMFPLKNFKHVKDSFVLLNVLFINKGLSIFRQKDYGMTGPAILPDFNSVVPTDYKIPPH